MDKIIAAGVAVCISACGVAPTDEERLIIEETIENADEMVTFLEELLPYADPLFDASGNTVDDNNIIGQQVRESLDMFEELYGEGRVLIWHNTDREAVGEAHGSSNPDDDNEDYISIREDHLDDEGALCHEGAHYLAGPHENGFSDTYMDLSSEYPGWGELTDFVLSKRDFPYLISRLMQAANSYHMDEMELNELDYLEGVSEEVKLSFLEKKLGDSESQWLDRQLEMYESALESDDDGWSPSQILKRLGVKPEGLRKALKEAGFFGIQHEVYQEYYTEITGKRYERDHYDYEIKPIDRR